MIGGLAVDGLTLHKTEARFQRHIPAWFRSCFIHSAGPYTGPVETVAIKPQRVLEFNVEITVASISDLPELCCLLNILFSQEQEFHPDQRAQSTGLSQIIENPEIGHIVVAREGDNIAGMVTVLYTVSTALGSRVALLEDMVVAPGARNAGIGSDLLERAIEVASDNGCKRITLLTDRSNEQAQRFYKKHGFVDSPMIPLRRALGSN